jgi:hypothetical protein
MPQAKKKRKSNLPQVTNSTLWPIVSHVPEIQAEYESMREAGESHNIAEMCAFRKGPTLETDTTFTRGYGTHPFGKRPPNPLAAKRYLAEAKKAGVNISGKRYLSGLARFPGDPQAWVTSKSDVKKLCESRGWGCEGAVKVTARPKRNGATEKRHIA